MITRTLGLLIEESSVIFKHTFRRGDVYNFNRTKGVPCVDPPVPWMHGARLMRGMKTVRHYIKAFLIDRIAQLLGINNVSIIHYV